MEYDIIQNSFGTFYYKKGTMILHRSDGPAVIPNFNQLDCQWWIYGRRLTKEEEGKFNAWFNWQLNNFSS